MAIGAQTSLGRTGTVAASRIRLEQRREMGRFG
jgi:hypothetical protein